MKKLLISFSFGLLLSIVPITGFAASGKTFNVQRLFFGECPETIEVTYTIGEGECAITVTVECELTGESPKSGGVSVCSYSCGTLE